MAILVSGGAGYIGSHTCVELLEAGYDIVVADNFYNSCPEVRAPGEDDHRQGLPLCGGGPDRHGRRWRPCSPPDPDIDCVIQFAAYKAVGESVAKPIEYYSNNLACTLNVLDAMRRHDVQQLRLLLLRHRLRRPRPACPSREDFPTGATTNPYGTTKLFIERILTDCCHADPELNVALLRYFNPIGAHPVRPDRRGPQRHPQQPRALHRQGGCGQAGEGPRLRQRLSHPRRHRRAGLHPCGGPGQAAMWLPSKSWSRSPACFICNLGTGHGYSVLDVIHAFSKACGKEIPYVIDPRRPGDIAECWCRSLQGQARSWAGRPSTALRKCAPTAGTGRATTRTGIRPRRNRPAFPYGIPEKAQTPPGPAPFLSMSNCHRGGNIPLGFSVIYGEGRLSGGAPA